MAVSIKNMSYGLGTLLCVEMQVYSGWVNCHQRVSKAGWFDDFVRPSSW